MDRKTKSFISIFVITLLIIPQITFAAWWNPTTWKVWQIFTRQNVETQIVEIEEEEEEEEAEEVVQEAEPVVDSTPSTPAPATPSVSTPPTQVNVVPPVVPVITQPAKDYIKIYGDLRAEYSSLRRNITEARDSLNNNKEPLNIVEREYEQNLTILLNEFVKDVQILNTLNTSDYNFPNNVEFYLTRYSWLMSELNRFTRIYKDELQKYNLNNEMNRVLNSPAERQARCDEAYLVYRSATDREFEITEKYNAEMKRFSIVPGMTITEKAQFESNILQRYQWDIAPARLEVNRAARDIQLYCQGQPVSSPQIFTPYPGTSGA